MINITSKQVAHMTAQIRAKQLATKYSQDKLQKIIIEYREAHPDVSDKNLARQFTADLDARYSTSLLIDKYLTGQDVKKVGYPIKNNKTIFQIDMSKEWEENQREDLISQIKQNKFYHKLTNNIVPTELPTLQSPSDKEYWGNENASVSSVLLASFAATCNKKQDNIPGAATFFASKDGMMLFGDYQFGAHRDFEKQLLFGPEDCSTAVGKATYRATEEIQSITTARMIKAYHDPNNEYHYRAVTHLQGEVGDEQLKLI